MGAAVRILPGHGSAGDTGTVVAGGGFAGAPRRGSSMSVRMARFLDERREADSACFGSFRDEMKATGRPSMLVEER